MPVATSLALVFVLVPAIVAAQTAQPATPPPRHEQSFEASFVGVSGNASTNTFGIGAEVIARPGTWVLRYRNSFVRNESNDQLQAKAFEYDGRVEKTLNGRASTFADHGFFRDRFAGVVSRRTVTGGLTLRALETNRQRLAIDLGAGYLDESRVAGSGLSSGSYVAGAAYEAELSTSAKVSDELRLTGLFEARDDWRAEHTVAITTTLVSGLSLKVSNALRFANKPPPGFERTDSVTAVAIVATFTH